ncbi:hypothetical protein NEOLEDRAFT_164632 [Neolentinus lepideus HHB14362 ss-1]|uniref:Uncharacterized protein n=1 Tax=Neolentinus lepideus HHB14362 ss-1 TaxID=1314782 RepID=A0A165TV43_9AGAM|nr:hypothetical protein NEOLEDRAFT_164632 [Neolentinus lepideus HHB14362 ss-1]
MESIMSTTHPRPLYNELVPVPASTPKLTQIYTLYMDLTKFTGKFPVNYMC